MIITIKTAHNDTRAFLVAVEDPPKKKDYSSELEITFFKETAQLTYLVSDKLQHDVKFLTSG